MRKKRLIFVFLLIVFTFLFLSDFTNAAIRNCYGCSNCTQEFTAAASGDTVRLNNSITSTGGVCIYIDKQNITFDCQNFSNYIQGRNTWTFGDKGISGSLQGSRINDTIKNCNISGFTYGIDFQADSSNVFLNITLFSNYVGISIDSTSNNNTLSNITAYNHNASSSSTGGAVLIYGSNNTLINLISYNNGKGLSLGGSGNVLRNNNMSNNTVNFSPFGTNNSVDTSNIVDYSYKIYYNYSIFNYIFNTVTAPNAGMIYCYTCNNITVQNLNLSHYNGAGVYLYRTNNSLIQNLTSLTNTNGISISIGSNDTITNMTLGNNTGSGLSISSSSNITVNNVTAINSAYGIYIDSCSGTILRNNNFSGNTWNFYISGGSNSQYNHSIDSSNIMDYSYKIYYNYTTSNSVYNSATTPNAGTIYCINCNNITIQDLNLSHYTSNGVFFYNTNNSIIQNVTTALTSTGISLSSSSNNNLLGNITSNKNGGTGISLSSSSNNTLNNITTKNRDTGVQIFSGSNNFLTNFIESNSSNGYGLVVSGSNNLLTNLAVTGNWVGIGCTSASNNTFSNILATNNTDGFLLYSDSNNVIKNSNISNNTYGLDFYFSSINDLIYNNYFNNYNMSYWNESGDSILLFNTTQTCGTNIIGGPYVGGNYWAYQNGTGSSQICTDANLDGICDSSLSLDGVTYDYLPLTFTAGASCPSGTTNDTTTTSTSETTVQNQTSTPNVPIQIIINDSQLDLTKVVISFVEAVSGVSFTITSIDLSPTLYTELGLPVGNSYQVFTVNGTGVTENQIANASIDFKVNKTWISDRGGSSSDIKMYRKEETSNQWNALPTTFKGEDNKYYYFNAVSPGFSTFAVFFGTYECQPGINRCFENQVQFCLGNATWLIKEKCEYFCRNGECVTSIAGVNIPIIFYSLVGVIGLGVIFVGYSLLRVALRKR